MATSLLGVLIVMGLAVVAAEGWVIREQTGHGVIRVTEVVALSPPRARRALVAWLTDALNPLGTAMTAETDAGAVFRWSVGGQGVGEVQVAVAPGGRAEVTIEADLALRGRRLGRIGLLLVAIVGVPLAVGLPLLAHVLVARSGQRSYYLLLFLLVQALWPLFPVGMVVQETHRAHQILETMVRNLPVLADAY